MLLATENQAKARELAALFQGISYQLVTPRDVGIKLDVAETGATMEDNARLKARAYADAAGLVTLADDSGLEVDALNGAPGVRSRRFAGERASDDDRIAFILEKLKGVAWEKRTAKFRCVIAIVDINGSMHTCKGECPGVITFEPRGNLGFGYDPVFFLPEMDKTMAELPSEAKNRISHRARAAQKARIILEQFRTEMKS